MKADKLLVIDDDELFLSTARWVLEQAGYDVVTYAGRFDRLNVVLREQPDLLLLDVNMPAVAGDELFGLLRDHESLRTVPVAFCSSNHEHDLRLLVRQTGALGYVPKSALAADLPLRVGRLLAEARRQRASA